MHQSIQNIFQVYFEDEFYLKYLNESVLKIKKIE